MGYINHPKLKYRLSCGNLNRLNNARTPKYLVIHYTAGGNSNPGRAGEYQSLWSKPKGGSADFAVDDAYWGQYNPDIEHYYCNAVGSANQYKNSYGGSKYGNQGACNSNCISIEVCSSLKKGTSAAIANHAGWYFTNAVLRNAIELAALLMKLYHIDINHVIRHYDVSGKPCPGIIGWNVEIINSTQAIKKDGKSHSVPTGERNNDSAWINFKRELKKAYDNSNFDVASITNSTDSYEPNENPLPVNQEYSDEEKPLMASRGGNKVYNLSGAKTENALEINDSRKNRFRDMAQRYASEAPDFGREIIIVDEMYGNEILKNGQQAKTMRNNLT